jgi:hypothetical protein
MNRSCRICHTYKEDTGADQLAWHLLAQSRGGLLVRVLILPGPQICSPLWLVCVMFSVLCKVIFGGIISQFYSLKVM